MASPARSHPRRNVSGCCSTSYRPWLEARNSSPRPFPACGPSVAIAPAAPAAGASVAIAVPVPIAAGRSAGPAVARGPLGRGVGLGVLVGLAERGQRRLAGQLDPVLVVDGDRLDEHRVADPADVGHAADVAVGQLADVHQAVLAGQDLDEGAEVLDRRDAALVDPADLDPFGHRLDLVAGGLGAGGVGARQRDDAVIFDVDLRPGLVLEAADRLAAGADHETDLL